MLPSVQTEPRREYSTRRNRRDTNLFSKPQKSQKSQKSKTSCAWRSRTLWCGDPFALLDGLCQGVLGALKESGSLPEVPSVDLTVLEFPQGEECLAKVSRKKDANFRSPPEFTDSARDLLRDWLEGAHGVSGPESGIAICCHRSLEIPMRELVSQIWGTGNFVDSLTWRHRYSGGSFPLSGDAARARRVTDTVLIYSRCRETREELLRSLDMAEFFGAEDSPEIFFQGLVERLSGPGSRVLVPFADSPAVCIAADRSGCEWMGMVQDPGPELEREFRLAGVPWRTSGKV